MAAVAQLCRCRGARAVVGRPANPSHRHQGSPILWLRRASKTPTPAARAYPSGERAPSREARDRPCPSGSLQQELGRAGWAGSFDSNRLDSKSYRGRPRTAAIPAARMSRKAIASLCPSQSSFS